MPLVTKVAAGYEEFCESNVNCMLTQPSTCSRGIDYANTHHWLKYPVRVWYSCHGAQHVSPKFANFAHGRAWIHRTVICFIWRAHCADVQRDLTLFWVSQESAFFFIMDQDGIYTYFKDTRQGTCCKTKLPLYWHDVLSSDEEGDFTAYCTRSG